MRKLSLATTMLVLAWAYALPIGGQPSSDDPQKKAIFQLMDLAEVAIGRDDAKPGKPVVAVDFADQAEFKDDWLKILDAFPELNALRLDRTSVTDTGLEHVKRFSKLAALSLVGTQVSDAGVSQLKGLASLRTLDVRETTVSSEAVAELRKAIPELQVSGGAPQAPTASGKFTAEQIKKLREAADAAVALPEQLADGWIKSPVDPAKLLDVFKPLRLRKGLVLRAYLFTSGGNGNGVVWAMPADAEFPEPKDCPVLEGHLFNAPKPSEALDDVMEAIEGDGSARSYMMASFLRRQFAAFGARWHGAIWSVHAILDANPLARPAPPDADPISHPQGNGEWKWQAPEPADWSPQVKTEGDRVVVTFYTFCGHETQRLFQHTDTYRAGKYRPKVEQKPIAEDGPGFMF